MSEQKISYKHNQMEALTDEVLFRNRGGIIGDYNIFLFNKQFLLSRYGAFAGWVFAHKDFFRVRKEVQPCDFCEEDDIVLCTMCTRRRLFAVVGMGMPMMIGQDDFSPAHFALYKAPSGQLSNFPRGQVIGTSYFDNNGSVVFRHRKFFDMLSFISNIIEPHPDYYYTDMRCFTDWKAIDKLDNAVEDITSKLCRGSGYGKSKRIRFYNDAILLLLSGYREPQWALPTRDAGIESYFIVPDNMREVIKYQERVKGETDDGTGN